MAPESESGGPGMTTREMTYAVLVALGVLLPMYYNVQYLGAGGNLLMDFFTAPMQSAVTASLLFDLLIAFAAVSFAARAAEAAGLKNPRRSPGVTFGRSAACFPTDSLSGQPR